MPGDRLVGLKDWVLYYGTDRATEIERYDLAVVAPEAWDAESVRAKQRQGTLMLAYVSVLEVPRERDRNPPANVLVIDGKPTEQTRWSNWILDPRQDATSDRLKQICRALQNQHFDGFFLDTLGDVESTLLPMRLRGTLVPATGRLVANLRAQFPTALMVQNWGLGALLDLTLPYLDGVCWEDFPLGPPQAWQEQLATHLTQVQATGTRVFALGHEEVAEGRALAAKLGFCWYGAPGSYIIYKTRNQE